MGARRGHDCGILRSRLKCRIQELGVISGRGAAHGVHEMSMVLERAAACPAKAGAQQTLHIVLA